MDKSVFLKVVLAVAGLAVYIGVLPLVVVWREKRKKAREASGGAEKSGPGEPGA